MGGRKILPSRKRWVGDHLKRENKPWVDRQFDQQLLVSVYLNVYWSLD
jgi:hypothetical protein